MYLTRPAGASEAGAQRGTQGRGPNLHSNSHPKLRPDLDLRVIPCSRKQATCRSHSSSSRPDLDDRQSWHLSGTQLDTLPTLPGYQVAHLLHAPLRLILTFECPWTGSARHLRQLCPWQAHSHSLDWIGLEARCCLVFPFTWASGLFSAFLQIMPLSIHSLPQAKPHHFESVSSPSAPYAAKPPSLLPTPNVRFEYPRLS